MKIQFSQTPVETTFAFGPAVFSASKAFLTFEIKRAPKVQKKAPSEDGGAPTPQTPFWAQPIQPAHPRPNKPAPRPTPPPRAPEPETIFGIALRSRRLASLVSRAGTRLSDFMAA